MVAAVSVPVWGQSVQSVWPAARYCTSWAVMAGPVLSGGAQEMVTVSAVGVAVGAAGAAGASVSSSVTVTVTVSSRSPVSEEASTTSS